VGGDWMNRMFARYRRMNLAQLKEEYRRLTQLYQFQSLAKANGASGQYKWRMGIVETMIQEFDPLDVLREFMVGRSFVRSDEVAKLLDIGKRKAAFMIRKLGWTKWAQNNNRTVYARPES